MCRVWMILCLTLFLVSWIQETQANAPSHYCYATRYKKVKDTIVDKCYGRHRICSGSWWRKRCTYRCYDRTVFRYRSEAYQYRKCCDGWTGSLCNQPVCSPSCGNGGVCLSPTQGCYCRNGNTGSSCQTAICSYQTDCWPGTCKGGGECHCSSGFTGNNCQEIRDGPIFKQCNTKLIVKKDTTEEVVFDEVCGKPGYQNSTFYTNNQDFNYISMTWDTFFYLPEDTPVKPRYLYSDVPGIINVYGNFKLLSAENETKYERNVVCGHPAHLTDPHLNAECRDIRELFNEPVKHLYRLDVNLYGESGGFKEVRNEHTTEVEKKTYTGTTTYHNLHIYFDLEPPKHCSMDESCGEDAFDLPIYLDPDISKTRVQILWSGWIDVDTGLDSFIYDVYRMAINQNGRLEEIDEAIATGDWDDEDDTEPPSFLPPEPGMYSIILTVADVAGNRMLARSLVLFDPQHNITTNPDKAFYVKNAHREANYEWMHNTDDDLQVTWEDYFENKFHVENNLLERVQKFDTPYDDIYGNRTKDEILHENGIILFEMAKTINSNELDKVPEVWENMTLQQNTLINMPRRDGDVIRIWIKAHDAMENVKVEHITVEIDTTPPIYLPSRTKIVKNVATEKPRPLFASRLDLTIFDTHSGIDELQYEVHEIINHNTTSIIHQGTDKGTKVDKSRAECDLSNDCECIANGDCYARVQPIYLNNCWFMDKEEEEFKVKFTAYNKARLSTQSEYFIGKLEGIRGRGEYPPVLTNSLKVSPDSMTSNRARIEWQYPDACYQVKQSIISYKHDDVQKEHTVSTSYIILEELNANTDYDVSVKLEYQHGQKSSPQTMTFTTMERGLDGNGQIGGPGDGEGTGIGVIVGGVIGALVVILLVVLIIVMLMRRRQGNPMIPEPITRAGNTIRSRFSTYVEGPGEHDLESAPPPYTEATTSTLPPPPQAAAALPSAGKIAYINNAYDEDDEVYVYGAIETDENARWNFASDRIQFGEPVPNAKGRFADFRFATITTKHGKERMVAKMLKPTADDNDKLLMKAKMNFLATNKTMHKNVVRFIGALQEDLTLLFEYCDEGRLSDWLTKITKLSEEQEDNLHTFSIMIAGGMEFLHSKGVIHRRLGVRNILLQKDNMGNLVPKITGFGPMAGEEAGNGKTLKDQVPMKYLAPEQMQRPTKGVRKYTKESDVWTYGILLWEIYSKGDNPYPGMKKNDVLEQVQNGYRMPKPNYCPDFVYSDVITECWYPKPTARPTMDSVYTSLKHHFDGGAGASADLYYDESEIAEMEDEFYGDVELPQI